MTGKEKIQAFIHEIDTAHQELISGNKVRLYSGTFTGKGISLEEQKQILDILVSDKKAIKYTSENVYESEDDIDYEMKIHIQEESMMDGIAERYMIEQLLVSQYYQIEVLDAFEELKDFEDNEDQQSSDLKPVKSEPADWLKLKLEPSDYDKVSGSIRLAPHVIVYVSKRKKAKRADGKKYIECVILERVFKTVNTLKVGVPFSKILTLHDSKIGLTEKRSVRNAVDAINNKVTGQRGPERLLIVQNNKVFINNSYL